MGNFDLPTSEYRGASMSYLTTLISEKMQRCDSPEDTQLVNVGLTLKTLESQWPPHPSVCCKPDSSFECNCIQWYLNVYCLTFLVICGGYQFRSVTQLCPTLCGPMDCNTPGLPIHHQLPELTQTHVH